jgi:hypothetical protein
MRYSGCMKKYFIVPLWKINDSESVTALNAEAAIKKWKSWCAQEGRQREAEPANIKTIVRVEGDHVVELFESGSKA